MTQPQTARPGAPPSDGAPAPSTPPSVLVVANNQHMRRLLRLVLADHGFDRVTEAGDGGDAIRRIRSSPPDLVIADWVMSPMDGLDLTRYLRRSGHSPARLVPIILLAATAEGKPLALAMEAGASEIVPKPIYVRTLMAAVRDALRKRPGDRVPEATAGRGTAPPAESAG